MKLTTKGKYAVTAMLYLAVHERTGPVSLTLIASNLGISISYAEQLFAKLRESKLVKGVRGPGGGYRLGAPRNEISIGRIIEVVDEADAPGGEPDVVVSQPQQPGEEPMQEAPMSTITVKQENLCADLWGELSSFIREYLYGIDLETFLGSASVQAVLEKAGVSVPRPVSKIA